MLRQCLLTGTESESSVVSHLGGVLSVPVKAMLSCHQNGGKGFVTAEFCYSETSPRNESSKHSAKIVF